MWQFAVAQRLPSVKAGWGGGGGTGARSPHSSMLRTSRAVLSCPCPSRAHQAKESLGHVEKFCQDFTQRAALPHTHTSSVQGCKLTLVFPNGLLDLFLMCIYKEFTVGKGLGLPPSAIWVFFLLLCAYLSISGKEMFMTYIALPFGGGSFCIYSLYLAVKVCAVDTLPDRLKCIVFVRWNRLWGFIF